MKGVVFTAVGAEPKVVNDLIKGKPDDDQILVKSLWTAINPVDAFMSQYGLLVLEWPLVLGVDAAGVVVAAGATATSKYGFKSGSYVCGCTRLGMTQYSTGQEYYLMDARVTIAKPSNISVQQSATLGVGILTASLGLFEGLHVPLPDPSNLPAYSESSPWILILGGASSVGKYAIQLARVAGYNVLASCSPGSKELLASLGAQMFNYKLPLAEQVQAVMDITDGKGVTRIFDAVAADNPEIAKEIFKQTSAPEKFFTTTNDWSGIPDFEGGKTHWVQLGEVGRPAASAQKLNDSVASYVPVIKALVESGKVVPAEVVVVGGEEGGFDAALEAYKFQQTGKGGSKKVVVKIGDE